MTAGNIAYVFQGKYLIPVAAYFYSALEMLQKVIGHKKFLGGIGGISGIPAFENDNIDISNRQFQYNKIKTIKLANFNDATYGTYKYPQHLNEYGGTYGKQLYNKLVFNRISITLIIDKLESFFKGVI